MVSDPAFEIAVVGHSPSNMDKSLNRPVATFTVGLRSPESLFLPDSPLLRDELHPEIAQVLLDWARTAGEKRQLAINFALSDAIKTVTEEQVANVVSSHFLRMAENHTRRIRDIFRYARVTSVVGLLVVILLLGSAQAISDDAGNVMASLRESLTIFAWVAMWKPAELWLYAHWPERHWRRLALCLAKARISLVSESTTRNEA